VLIIPNLGPQWVYDCIVTHYQSLIPKDYKRLLQITRNYGLLYTVTQVWTNGILGMKGCLLGWDVDYHVVLV